ncbi:MAG: hypothetical protein ACR2QF_15550 [Geminicoccaceae bacterium]
MPEYIVIAYDPDHRQTGDHLAQRREDAIDYVRHYLDEENRDGAYVTISVVRPDHRQHDTKNR